ncbi:cystein proteinase inhibitor protein salarin-like [Engraulis encrasicolus]|uniref:cystein proteinase inhibitor protein salarin-like n=1 Tax=Engraulis encrasicolus TaxID=184585 RepID=UPI002FD5DA9E
MKLLVVATALVTAVSCASLGSVHLDREFQEWKFKFGKVYRSPGEEWKRKQIWTDTWDRIEAHNARFAQGLETWSMGLNQFSDMTSDEFTSWLGMPPLNARQLARYNNQY